jgi:hypothetical protein
MPAGAQQVITPLEGIRRLLGAHASGHRQLAPVMTIPLRTNTRSSRHPQASGKSCPCMYAPIACVHPWVLSELVSGHQCCLVYTQLATSILYLSGVLCTAAELPFACCLVLGLIRSHWEPPGSTTPVTQCSPTCRPLWSQRAGQWQRDTSQWQ